MRQIHSPDGATAAVFNESLILRHFNKCEKVNL